MHWISIPPASTYAGRWHRVLTCIKARRRRADILAAWAGGLHRHQRLELRRLERFVLREPATSGYRRFSSAMPTSSMMTPAAIAIAPPSVSGAANNITAPSAISSAATTLLGFMGRQYSKPNAGT